MSTADRWAAAVIGGGVVGSAVLFQLARHGITGVLIEAEPDLGEGVSKANSAIVHTGFDSRPGSLESRLLRRAAELWPHVIEGLGVPFLAVGALMLARTADERARLLMQTQPLANRLGVRTQLLERPALRDVAPYVTEDALAALSIPHEGVIDPFWLTRAYAEAAIAGGAVVRTGDEVVRLAIEPDWVAIELADGARIEADQVFDCAGLRADDVARLAGDDSFAIAPRKGQFLVSKETFGVNSIVLPLPSPLGKGMLVTPTVFGGLLLGPTAVDQADKNDRSTDADARCDILDSCRSLVPAVRDMAPIRSFAGLRTVSSTGDYIVRPSAVSDRLFLVAGMRSTGVSASPAIAELAVDQAGRLRGWARLRASRPLKPQPPADTPPGEIVCLCRLVSRGEIEAACRRPTRPRTLDAIKRRGGALFGDCQGNMCALGVASVLASERAHDIAMIEKGPPGSWLFRRQRSGRAPKQQQSHMAPDRVDTIVVGGGLAGVGAAMAIGEAGLSTLIIERRERLMGNRVLWTPEERRRLEPRGPGAGELPLVARLTETAIALVPEDTGWIVLSQSPWGKTELHARAVLVATGGYIEPREHRAIAGPRPAGVMTADLVSQASGVGLVPGERAVVVGAGRIADLTIHDLEQGGCHVVEHLVACTIEELRGDRRLEAVRAGGSWIDCDTLVLADRLLAAPFLLRGLNIVDARPGTVAPADAEGRLPLPGLWAAGTCVRPDVNHAGSLADGLRVGSAVAMSLVAGDVR